MEFTSAFKDRTGDIIAMFDKTFADSEGIEAGQLIKELVADMLASLSDEDMFVFSAIEDGDIVGSIIFTRMTYEQDTRTVFILAPVAVSTSQQGQGLGQRLIVHGLQALRDNGVDVALTYGDIDFYSKVGFNPITETDAQPPLPLQHPEGWLGQSLSSAHFEPLVGPSRCVAPLNDPNHWYSNNAPQRQPDRASGGRGLSHILLAPSAQVEGAVVQSWRSLVRRNNPCSTKP